MFTIGDFARHGRMSVRMLRMRHVELQSRFAVHGLGTSATWTWIGPTDFTTAFPHDNRPFGERTIVTPEGERRYDEQPFWISHASLAGLPRVSAPVGRIGSGLPVGMQVLGPLCEDDTAMTFAG